ncbi:MAG: hypothetical protein HY422_03480 [Candidatus Komeilibacteria bacterium]|nr:hypothetical protein [Candidatus Komeilibacteria bacterium]
MPDPSAHIDRKLLERGYWIATHRISIIRWTTIALYIVIAFVYVVFFVQFGVYTYRFNDWDELMRDSIASQYSWSAIHERQAPLEVEFGQPYVFPVGDSRYDFAVEVYNPNAQWALESLSYQFTYGEGLMTPAQETFVLPKEQKYLTVFSFVSDLPIPSVAEVKEFNYRWKKVSRLPPLAWDYIEPPAYAARQIRIENGVQQVIPAHVSWVVQNASTFNLSSVTWQIGLYSGTRLAGVASYTTERLTFLEERPIELFLPDTGARIDSVKVYPIVNIFDPNFTYLR